MLLRARSFGLCSLGSCEQGVLVPFAVSARADQERLVSFAVSARADQERWCCLLCSCRPEALVSPFMFIRTKSIDVTFYAHADQECCATQFRLVQARSFVFYSLGSCGQ
ncbi:hypothetical protein ACFX19_033990 [Malus domestica]